MLHVDVRFIFPDLRLLRLSFQVESQPLPARIRTRVTGNQFRKLFWKRRTFAIRCERMGSISFIGSRSYIGHVSTQHVTFGWHYSHSAILPLLVFTSLARKRTMGWVDLVRQDARGWNLSFKVNQTYVVNSSNYPLPGLTVWARWHSLVPSLLKFSRLWNRHFLTDLPVTIVDSCDWLIESFVLASWAENMFVLCFVVYWTLYTLKLCRFRFQRNCNSNSLAYFSPILMNRFLFQKES